MASSQAKGRHHRAKVMAQRSSKALSGVELAQAQIVVDEEAHNFRLPEPSRDLSKKTAILTVFHVREAEIEVERRISASRCAFQYNPEARIASEKTYARVIPIPLRPPWNSQMPAERVKKNEEKRFDRYLELIYNALPPGRLNHFEHNLDVWRQLWRTCELSDVLLLCVDARHPLFHFPPSLHDFIVNKMKKPMVVVFNKIDLVPQDVLMGWKEYFESRFTNVTVVFFTSYPLPGTVTFEGADIATRRKQVAGLDGRAIKKPKPVGVRELIEAVRKIALASLTDDKHDYNSKSSEYEAEGEDENSGNNEAGLSVHTEKQSEEDKSEKKQDEDPDQSQEEENKDQKATKDYEELFGPVSEISSLVQAAREVAGKVKDGATQVVKRGEKTRVFTIGMVGHPNAGKSSLINSILGRNAVSVSNTPGHTKHLQTITAIDGARDIQLCDCPGLVFPAADMPRPLQVLMGIFPISSIREPYSAVHYLAERLPLVDIYELQPYVGADSDAALTGPSGPISLLVESIAYQRTRALQRKITDGLADPESHIDPVTADDIAGYVTSPLPIPKEVVDAHKSGAKQPKRSNKNKRFGDDEDGVGEADLFESLNAALAADSVLRGKSRANQGRSGASRVSADRAAVAAGAANDLTSLADGEYVWSAWRICEALAMKKNWKEEGGRPDTYRAGMHILRDTLEGRVSLYFQPPQN